MYSVHYVANYVLYMTVFNCISGTAAITNGMATVTINNLQCGVTYNIIAKGALNGMLVGPKSSHGNVAAGPCPVIASTYVCV